MNDNKDTNKHKLSFHGGPMRNHLIEYHPKVPFTDYSYLIRHHGAFVNEMKLILKFGKPKD